MWLMVNVNFRPVPFDGTEETIIVGFCVQSKPNKLI